MPKRTSDSDSDRGSYRRKKSSRRRSSSLSDMSSDQSLDAKHRASRRSRSRSRDRFRRQRSRSRSASRSPKRKSRYSRSRSSSKGRRSRRSSRSRSSSRGKSHASKHNKTHHHHKSRVSSKSQSTSKTSHSLTASGQFEKDEGTLQNKIQLALKAAANANAELREKGLLPSGAATEPSAMSIADQLKRAQAIEEINAPSFSQQMFLSSRSTAKQSTEKSSEDIGLDAHSAAIFGLAAPKLGVSTSSDASIKKLESWKENPEKLVHENLSADQTGKEERWKKKLMALRRKNLNGEVYM